MAGQRFEFRSNPKYDLALLTEAEGINPYASAGTSKAAWTEVATNLQRCVLKMPVTERSCKKRVELLLKDFQEDETLSKRA